MAKLIFQEELCKGCGLCVNACPKGRLTKLKKLHKKELVNYSKWIMLMFNHILAHKQTWLYFLHY